jgi:hypothetical protein
MTALPTDSLDANRLALSKSGSRPGQFDLRETIRAVAAETGLVDPGQIADVVLERFTRAETAAALRITLSNYVRLTLSASTSALTSDPPDATEYALPSGPARPGINRNTRADVIRAQFAKFRAESIYVGSEWKRIGACTPDDLRIVAKRRVEQAADLQAEAERWARLADAMSAAEVPTVDDLPDDVLRAWRDGTS